MQGPVSNKIDPRSLAEKPTDLQTNISYLFGIFLSSLGVIEDKYSIDTNSEN